MGSPRSEGLGRIDQRPDRRLAREQPLLVKQSRQRDPGEARAAPLEERPAVEQVAAGVGEMVVHGCLVMTSQ